MLVGDNAPLTAQVTISWSFKDLLETGDSTLTRILGR